MQLEQAQNIAQKYLEELRPFSKRSAIAGSVRRERPTVKDIEMVMVRKTSELIAFKNYMSGFISVKGSVTGKYMQVILPEGIKLDLFMVNLDNWGNQFAIRTGSAQFSHKILATGWVKKGYISQDGYLYNQNEENGPLGKVLLYEETDLFKLIGLPWLEPKYREVGIFKIPMNEMEYRAIRALSDCVLLPGSWDKEFSATLHEISKSSVPSISIDQKKHLWKIVHKYRRQITDGELLDQASRFV